MEVDIEKTVFYAKVAGIGIVAVVVIYGVYEIASGIFGVAKKLTADTPASVKDTNGDYSGGLVEKAINNSLSIGKSGESYTDAVTNVILHPWDSAKSILGVN